MPWERVPDPPRDAPLATAILISLLNEWAKKQEYQVLQSGDERRNFFRVTYVSPLRKCLL
jgi:hypothetical protein